MIIDCHAYCFPDQRGPVGFPSLRERRLHAQKTVANHHTLPRRARDGKPGTPGGLMDLARWPADDAVAAVDFRPTDYGRWEWTVGGERMVKQYLPPSIKDMAYSADALVAEMDYAGVDRALLHRSPWIGLGNDFIADCVGEFPGRLSGLAHVAEWTVASDPDAAVAEVTRAVRRRGLSGLQFLTSQLHLKGAEPDWAGQNYWPFWDGVAALRVPVFFSLNINEPKREPWAEHYALELSRLQRWSSRYPGAKVVMTHGFQWLKCIQGDNLVIPEFVWAPFENPDLSLQLLFPIGLASLWDYPLPQTRPVVEECVQRIGAHRLMWGTDMPIVMRHWTYRQNIDFLRNYAGPDAPSGRGYLSSAEYDLIMGGTVAKLLGVFA